MKKHKGLTLLGVLISLALLSGCFSQPTLSAEVIQTQAGLFAQATLTRIAVETQMAVTPTSLVVNTNTATSPVPTATSVPPTATNVPPTATATAVPPTNTPIPPSATATQVPTVGITYITQSTTPKPVVTDPIRVSFAEDTTNINVEGSVAHGSVRRYVFWAAKNQLIDVSVDSAKDLVISISSAKGAVLLPFSKGWTSYRGYLTANGDWYIDVKANPEAASFSVYLEIPERLSFPSDSYGMTATGMVPGGQAHNFLVWANKGQNLKVSVEPDDRLVLSIYHVNGDVLLSSMGGSSGYEGVLPEAGDYVINVIAEAGQAVNFSMPIEIR